MILYGKRYTSSGYNFFAQLREHLQQWGVVSLKAINGGTEKCWIKALGVQSPEV